MLAVVWQQLEGLTDESNRERYIDIKPAISRKLMVNRELSPAALVLGAVYSDGRLHWKAKQALL